MILANKSEVVIAFQDKASAILPELNKLKTPKTYLEILQISKREVPIGNLLAYFFDPNEEHGLNDLFIRSLLETECYHLNENRKIGKLSTHSFTYTEKSIIPEPDFVLGNITGVSVLAEDKTDNAKRIDILINSNEFVIAVEFKINHLLNNPLNTYTQHVIKEYCMKAQRKPVFFAVLTPAWKNPEQGEASENDTFRQIILNDFVGNIEQNLPATFLKDNNDNYYHRLLIDFIQTIKNRRRHQDVRELIRTSGIVRLYNDLVQGGHLGKVTQIAGGNEVGVIVSKLDVLRGEMSKKVKNVEKQLRNYIVTNHSNDSFNQYILLQLPKTDYALKIRLTLQHWSISQWQRGNEGGFTTLTENGYTKSFSYETSSNNIVMKAVQAIKEIQMSVFA